MSISSSAYRQIIREYNDRQIANARALADRRAEIDARIPELTQIEEKITSLYVALGIARIRKEGSADALRKEIADLTARKETLLKEAGYTPDALKMQYTCPKCEDTGFIDGEPCTCFKERVSELLFDASNIRGVLSRENFSHYTYKYYSDSPAENGRTPLSAAKDAVRKALAFLRDFDHSDTNLFIYGDTGVGKTFLCNCIAAELIGRGRSVVYLSAVRLFSLLADAAFNRRSESEDKDLMTRNIYDCDLLIIDDLGTEMTNSFTQTQLFDCINERALAGRHTVISANLTLNELQNNYSERISSRITGSYDMIKLYGDDIRMKKKLED